MVQYQHLYLDGKAIRGKQSRMQQLKEKNVLSWANAILLLHIS